jgi:5'(3')-deoxyribonucleotidase
MNPLPGAIDAVKHLHDSGHTVYVVSAPIHAISYGEKVEWVEQWLPFLGKKRTILAHDKHIIPADWLIDDAPHNAEAYRRANPNSKIATITYPYNQGCPEFDLLAESWLDTAKAWQEIVSTIEGT